MRRHLRYPASLLLVLLPGWFGCDSPRHTATSSGTGSRLYVSDETGGNVDVLDPGSGRLIERIAVGKRPRGIALSRDGRLLYVALSGSPIGGPGVDESKLPPADRSADGIGVVDISSHQLVRKFRSGVDPEAFGLSPDGRMLYVSNEDSGEMSAVDLRSGNVQWHVKVGDEPEGVAVRPDNKVIYVTCEADNLVDVVDASTHQVIAQITTAARPRAIAFTTDGQTAFVTDENGGAVTVIDTPAHRVTASIAMPREPGQQIPPRPMGIAFAPDQRTLFVSLGRAKALAEIDPETRRVTHVINDVGMRPWGMAVSRDGRRVYTANGPSGDVSIVDVQSGAILRRVVVGGSPWGAALAEPE